MIETDLSGVVEWRLLLNRGDCGYYCIIKIAYKIKKGSDTIEYLFVDREGLEPPNHGLLDRPRPQFLSNSKRIHL